MSQCITSVQLLHANKNTLIKKYLLFSSLESGNIINSNVNYEICNICQAKMSNSTKGRKRELQQTVLFPYDP
jgi:hypothetical protein